MQIIAATDGNHVVFFKAEEFNLETQEVIVADKGAPHLWLENSGGSCRLMNTPGEWCTHNSVWATTEEHACVSSLGSLVSGLITGNEMLELVVVKTHRPPEPTPEPVDTRQPWEKDRDDVLAKYPDAKSVRDESPTPHSHGVWYISGIEATAVMRAWMYSEPRAWVRAANKLFNRDNPLPEIYDTYVPESSADIPLTPVAQIVQKAVDETVPQPVAERTISRLSKFTDALQAGDMSAYRITMFQMDTDGRVSRDLMT